LRDEHAHTAFDAKGHRDGERQTGESPAVLHVAIDE